jgi:hypothetical protein
MMGRNRAVVIMEPVRFIGVCCSCFGKVVSVHPQKVSQFMNSHQIETDRISMSYTQTENETTGYQADKGQMPAKQVYRLADSRPATSSRQITTDLLQQEIDYWRSTKILEKMLRDKLISETEFKKIDILNRQSFKQDLAQIMP